MNIYVDINEIKDCTGRVVYVQPKVEINIELGERYYTEVLQELKADLQKRVEEGLSKALIVPVK